MNSQPLPVASEARNIIDLAISAHTVKDARAVNSLIASSVGERYARPLADRANNHGMMGGALPSYDALLVELPINGIDSVLEHHARLKYPNVPANKMPWKTPREAADELFAGQDKDQLGQLVQFHNYPADQHPSKSHRITPVVRDFGVGLTPKMVPETVFHLGSKYKDDLLWQQGAYGLGGAITYRNAQLVVLVSRRRPELLKDGEEDRITVAVCDWQEHTKGMGLYYLVTSDWRNNSGAEPWSAPASEYEEFEPGLHIALVGFQTKKFYKSRTDRDSIEVMLQTRVSDPVLPIGVHNHVAKGDHFKVPAGNKLVFKNNPRPDRADEDDMLLVQVGPNAYQLPLRWHVFRNGPNADMGGMRTFVWDKQAVHFTNNGYAHRHWSQQDLRVRAPKLSQIYDRLHVVVETDTLPISVRTKLFTPDRSTMRDTPTAERLEDALATYLQNNDQLLALNGELIRERLSGGQTGRSTRAVAEKISKALSVRGFASLGGAGENEGSVAKPPKKPPKQLYTNPTSLEGPVSVWAVPSIPKHINLHLNATDDFMPNRGQLTVISDCSLVSKSHVSVGQLRNGRIRVQLAIPESMSLGESFKLRFEVKDWILASGGTAAGSTLSWETNVSVVAHAPTPPKPNPMRKKKRRGKGNRTDSGTLVAVIWEPVDAFETWDKSVPGHVDNVSAEQLATHPDYAELATLGETEVQTIWLNEDYSPLSKYVQARIASKGASSAAIEQSRERYVLGVGVALLDLANSKQKAEKSGRPYDDEHYKHGRHAAAQGVIAMLPEYDALIKAAGIEG
jgi:hypothetical protein